jgi:hypothetical protein
MRESKIFTSIFFSVTPSTLVLAFLLTTGMGNVNAEDKDTIHVTFELPSSPDLKGWVLNYVACTIVSSAEKDSKSILSSWGPRTKTVYFKDIKGNLGSIDVKVPKQESKDEIFELHFDVWYISPLRENNKIRSSAHAKEERTIEGIPGSNIHLKYKYIDKEDEAITGMLASFGVNGVPPDIKLTSCVQTYVTLDKALKHLEVKESSPIRAAKDSPQVKKEDYTVKHSVGIQTGVKVDADVKVNWVVIEAGIKCGIELAANTTYEQSQTSTREVVIPANGKPYKVVWIETYRTGNATTIIDGVKHKVPFEFREGWDLQTELVEK